ncbi:hypothetical protein RRG08_040346 [Elysia crispata]|uniref:Uncharacterized protein n=1 Tax=Elysia crispata TaxID=231223 RepID=A0AAE0YTF1_9GAST|nr:hypothetical protein RRG08_040346 [Elysia crispata]
MPKRGLSKECLFDTLSSQSWRSVQSLKKKKAVYKARLKISRPPLPKNRQEIFQALNQLNTFSKHVWKNDAENNIVMLTSEECLNFLSSVTDIYADGTFKYCARYFYQLYTIHGLQDGISWLKLFFGLPALPPSAVGPCFADILFPRIPDDPRASLFSDYIVSTYIDEFSEFPPVIWASDNIRSRTTNACESFHFHFSKYFNCPHPNIFVFIEAVDEEMKKSTLKIRAVRNRS